jgi:hypothetical protein
VDAVAVGARVNLTLDKYMITQVDLGRVAGFDKQVMNRYLRGRITPPLRTMLIIDEALEILVEAEL